MCRIPLSGSCAQFTAQEYKWEFQTRFGEAGCFFSPCRKKDGLGRGQRKWSESSSVGQFPYPGASCMERQRGGGQVGNTSKTVFALDLYKCDLLPCPLHIHPLCCKTSRDISFLFSPPDDIHLYLLGEVREKWYQQNSDQVQLLQNLAGFETILRILSSNMWHKNGS